MAKRFAGFTPEQLGRIDPSLKGMQSDEQEKIIAANPALAARVGKMTQMAQKRIGFAEGGSVGLDQYGQQGNFVDAYGKVLLLDSSELADAKRNKERELKLISGQLVKDSANLSSNERADIAQQTKVAQEKAKKLDVSTLSNIDDTEAKTATPPLGSDIFGGGPPPDLTLPGIPKDPEPEKPQAPANPGTAVGELTNIALKTPEKLVKDIEVDKFTDVQKAAGAIAEGTGEAGTVDEASAAVATPASDVTAPAKPPVSTFLPEKVSAEVADTLKKLEAATGKPSDEALADAATMSPEDLKSLGLTVEQIDQARRVEDAPTRKAEADEMISGSAVDMARVKKEVNFEAATGAPSTDATVQGQLTSLMEDFEGKEPPAWAAGAMRAATARMASRGLSSSSMAGQAIVQAAMESAIPIASQDAKTVASFEMQNLSNRQQTAMFAAQQRAQFLGLEFNQEFQSRVSNAAKISDIANMNFSAEQQVALENARMAQTVDLTNLNAKNAKVMADAAAMSQVDMANLNNRQQANIQAASAFLQMDMANLSNEQQTTMFSAQSQVNAILSDQAAENAAKQFNASSENQVNQFFADLGARVQLANADQTNAMERFNAGEANALEQFNVAQANQREQFNSTNRLVVAQANASWAQAYTTADNAAINEANRLDAQRQGQMTLNAYNATIQTYRDLMSFANNTANNDADRATSIITTKISADAAKYGADKAAQAAASKASSDKTSSFWSAAGSWAASAFS